ncbi:hypothetical protein EDC94DRAFT_589468 [Helicostylum pulchrum]|nr:hypothetical protein EDC94DRAFT_589468 [Helicostylum pulchrum]
MLDLPSEIFRTIFQYLEKKDLQTCYFVCKSWYSIAIPLDWKEVMLTGSRISLVKSHLKDPNYRQYFKYSYLIVKLSIKDGFSSFQFSKPELLALLKHLPNLEDVDIRFTCHADEYIRFLLDADMPRINKINTGCFYGRFNSRFHYDVLFLVYYRFRDTITSVDLFYDKSIIRFNSQHINTLHSLTEFEKLTELNFQNKYDIDLTPFQVQHKCPNLKRLRFDSDFPISESTMLRLLDNNSRTNLNVFASLSHLDLRLPSLSATYTRYLVDYFPNQLLDFCIIISNQTMFNWIGSVGIEAALLFMGKVGSIKEANVDFETSYRFEELDFEETKTTIFFKLLNEFRRTRETYCKASFRGYNSNPVDAGAGYSFRYTCDDRLLIAYDIYDTFFPPLDLPDKTSSVIGPEIFNTLEFYISGVGDEVVLPTLDYSLTNCPRLQSFTLTGNKGHFEDLGFHLHCGNSQDIISSDGTNSDINYLKIEYINHVQAYFDVATAHLHNIEVISLEPYEWGSTDNDLVLNLTGFNKLKTFKYIARIDEPENNDYDFILFKYTNGEEHHYYLDDEKRSNLQVDYSQIFDTPSLTIYCDASVTFDFLQE